ncbi:MAG: hypothetical protein ACE5H0_07185 [Bacteroidota bacterium]
MVDKPEAKIKGDGKPESVTEAAFRLAEGLLKEREDRKAAIQEVARGFPPLYQIIRYSEGLGWRGTVSKRWGQFAEVYADFMQLANLLFDKFGNEYDEMFGDHPREERIWFMMCDKMRPVVEDVLALVYEMMPEIKREFELKTESFERTTYFEVLKTKEPEPKRTDPRLAGLLED